MRGFRFVPAAIFFTVTASATAGTEKVAFPAYQTHVLYDVLDQPEIKEIREAYINAEALKGIRPGQASPCPAAPYSACRPSRRA